MKDKVILTDCDGVLFDWEYAFGQWMKRHGYKLYDANAYNVADRYELGMHDKRRLVRMFNESAAIRKIPPLRDAIKYVRKLHQEHGFIFHAITSLSNDQYAQHLRTKNLIETFGPTVFEKYVYLDTGADKDEALAEYEGTECYWVEDKMENADVGSSFGLQSILIAHPYNAEHKGPAKRVQCWKEIYDLVTS